MDVALGTGSWCGRDGPVETAAWYLSRRFRPKPYSIHL